MAWDVVLLDSLANDFLAGSIRVNVGRVPGVQPTVISCL